MDLYTKVLLILAGSGAVLTGLEMAVGALPNNVIPYQSKILKKLGQAKGFVGKASNFLNNFDLKKKETSL